MSMGLSRRYSKMIHIISLLVSIALAIYIRRKGLTTLELREMLIAQGERVSKALVKFKLYRAVSGGVWLKIQGYGWVQARWCTDEDAGYLKRLDREGTLHKNYCGILELENYTWR